MEGNKPRSQSEISTVLQGNVKTGRHFWITVNGVNVPLDGEKVRASLGIKGEEQGGLPQLNAFREYRERLKALLGKEVPVVIEENDEGEKKVTAIKVEIEENDEFPGEVIGILEKSPGGGYMIKDSKNRIFFLTEQALKEFELFDRPIEKCLGMRIEGREEQGHVVEIYIEDSEVPMKPEFRGLGTEMKYDSFAQKPELIIPKMIRDLPETFENLEQAFAALDALGSIGIKRTDLEQVPVAFGRIYHKKKGFGLPVFMVDEAGKVSFSAYGKGILAE